MLTNCTVCCRLYLHNSGLSRQMNSHQQEQPSTCGQCGKTFNRADNLMKHLRHWTGNRQLSPPLPPPQQQTAAPPITTTEVQHPPSILVHGRCYGTLQHQYAEDTSPHPSVNCHPPPPTNNDTVPHQTLRIQVPGCHHDCVSQGGGSQRCHTTTNYHNFGND